MNGHAVSLNPREGRRLTVGKLHTKAKGVTVMLDASEYIRDDEEGCCTAQRRLPSVGHGVPPSLQLDSASATGGAVWEPQQSELVASGLTGDGVPLGRGAPRMTCLRRSRTPRRPPREDRC